MSAAVPVLVALASAASFATGSALQHRAVGDSSAGGDSDRHVLGELVRRPGWLVGLLLSAVAFALHATALGLGNLVLVQPIIVSGIVFAVIIRAALERRFPPARTVLWLLLTWGGLALFLAVHPSGRDQSVHETVAVIMVVAVVVVVIGLRLGAARARRGRLRGLLLGGSAGLLFGLVAGLVKLCLRDLGSGGFHDLLTSWPVWALIAIGIWAVILNQRAYQATKLSVSAPTLNVAQVLTALVFGVVVLSEPVGSSAGVLAGQAAGLLIMVAGIVRLASLD